MELGDEDALDVVWLRLILPPDHGEITLSMGLDSTVADLKIATERERPNIPATRQRIVWGGRQLADPEVLRGVFKKRIEEGVLSVHITMRRAPGSTPLSPSIPDSAPSTPTDSRALSSSLGAASMGRSFSAPTTGRSEFGDSRGRSWSQSESQADSPGLSPASPGLPSPGFPSPAAQPSVPSIPEETPAPTAPAPDSKPSATTESEGPPSGEPYDPAEAMRLFLLNQAYWQAAAQYGMIMTHAQQLKYEVPFGSDLFAATPRLLTHPTQAVPRAAAPPVEEEAPPPPPLNPEDAEIAAQIAEMEGQGFENRIKLAFKLAILVLLLHQDASQERLAMLCAVAVFIFLMQSGLLQGTVNSITGYFFPQNEAGPVEPEPPREGVVAEVRLFLYGFFASMFPAWQPPEYVPPPQEGGVEAAAPEEGAPQETEPSASEGATPEGDPTLQAVTPQAGNPVEPNGDLYDEDTLQPNELPQGAMKHLHQEELKADASTEEVVQETALDKPESEVTA